MNMNVGHSYIFFFPFRRAKSPFGSGSTRGGEGIPAGSGQAGRWRNAHSGIHCQIQNSKWAAQWTSLARLLTLLLMMQNTEVQPLYMEGFFLSYFIIYLFIHYNHLLIIMW